MASVFGSPDDGPLIEINTPASNSAYSSMTSSPEKKWPLAPSLNQSEGVLESKVNSGLTPQPPARKPRVCAPTPRKPFFSAGPRNNNNEGEGPPALPIGAGGSGSGGGGVHSPAQKMAEMTPNTAAFNKMMLNTSITGANMSLTSPFFAASAATLFDNNNNKNEQQQQQSQQQQQITMSRDVIRDALVKESSVDVITHAPTFNAAQSSMTALQQVHHQHSQQEQRKLQQAQLDKDHIHVASNLIPSHADLKRAGKTISQDDGSNLVGSSTGRVAALLVSVVTPAGVITEGEILSSRCNGEIYSIRCPQPDSQMKTYSDQASQRFRLGAPRSTQHVREDSIILKELKPYLETVERSVTPDGLTEDDIQNQTRQEKAHLPRFFTNDFRRRDVLPFGFSSPSSVFNRIGRHTNLGIIVGWDATFFTYQVEQRTLTSLATRHDTARGHKEVYSTRIISATLAELQLPPSLTRGEPRNSFRVGSHVECRRYGSHDLDDGVVVGVSRDVTYSIKFKYDDVVQHGILHSDVRLDARLNEKAESRAERYGVRDRVLIGLMGAKRATVIQCFADGRFMAVTDEGEQLLLGDSNVLSVRPPIIEAIGASRDLMTIFEELDEGLDGKIKWLKFKKALLSQSVFMQPILAPLGTSEFTLTKEDRGFGVGVASAKPAAPTPAHHLHHAVPSSAGTSPGLHAFNSPFGGGSGPSREASGLDLFEGDNDATVGPISPGSLKDLTPGASLTDHPFGEMSQRSASNRRASVMTVLQATYRSSCIAMEYRTEGATRIHEARLRIAVREQEEQMTQRANEALEKSRMLQLERDELKQQQQQDQDQQEVSKSKSENDILNSPRLLASHSASGEDNLIDAGSFTKSPGRRESIVTFNEEQMTKLEEYAARQFSSFQGAQQNVNSKLSPTNSRRGSVQKNIDGDAGNNSSDGKFNGFEMEDPLFDWSKSQFHQQLILNKQQHEERRLSLEAAERGDHQVDEIEEAEKHRAARRLSNLALPRTAVRRSSMFASSDNTHKFSPRNSIVSFANHPDGEQTRMGGAASDSSSTTSFSKMFDGQSRRGTTYSGIGGGGNSRRSTMLNNRQGAASSEPAVVSVISVARRRDAEGNKIEKALQRTECLHSEVEAALEKAFEVWQSLKGLPPNTLHSGHDMELSFKDLAFLFDKVKLSVL